MSIGIIFSGQGAQAVGMGKDLAAADADAKSVFDKADEILGHSLSHVCFEGPQEELTKSSNAQPGIFCVSVAAVTSLMKAAPDMNLTAAAGLSSGEWTALYFANAISLDDVLRVLQARGTFMQEECEKHSGGMLSVMGLPAKDLEPICEQAGIQIANLNSPEQTVLSGPVEGIEKAEQLAKDAGAKRAIRLNVSGAFHSRLMQKAEDRLREFLADIEIVEPRVPVISNVTGKPHGTPDEIRDAMAKQVTGSVQWVADILQMKDLGVKTYVECGPGKILTGLVRRIDKEAGLHNIQDRPSLEATASALS